MPSTGLWLLKTKAEARASTATIQVWAMELPSRSANSVLSLIKESVPDQDAVDLQHLRRFAKARFLPAHLLPEGQAASRSRSSSSRESSTRSRSRRRRGSVPATLYLLVCPVSCINKDDLTALLKTQPPFVDDGFVLDVKDVTVPMLPPTTGEQAEQWSQQYWPTIYRKTNPFGPHPSIIARSEEEVLAHGNVPRCMDLAKRVAVEAKTDCCGEGIGCVIIERTSDKEVAVIAMAGDGRYTHQDASTAQSNTMAHAVMRAIGMVARKRVRVATRDPTKLDQDMAALDINRPSHTPAPGAPRSVPKSLLDYPVTALERDAFDKDNLIPDGYLCVDLEIYLTHEPCVMCTMAILHSRFARCVFGARMPKTGALTAEGDGLGYGLFWRPELNWKLLCWEWKEDDFDKGEDDRHLILEENVQV